MRPQKTQPMRWTKQELLNTGGLAVKNDLIHAMEREQRAGGDHITVLITVDDRAVGTVPFR